jgi:5-deoxy-D-glucuronate isomerase
VNWHFPAGSTADGPKIVRITPERARWGYTGLQILELPAGQAHEGSTGQDEMVVLPLAGSCAVDCDAGGADLERQRPYL